MLAELTRGESASPYKAECIYPCTHLCVLSLLARFPLMHPNGPREPGESPPPVISELHGSIGPGAAALALLARPPFGPIEPWLTPGLECLLVQGL